MTSQLFNDKVLQDASPHHSLLLDILAKELNVAAKDIVDFELNLCDTQAGVIGGKSLLIIMCLPTVVKPCVRKKPPLDIVTLQAA